MIPDLLKDNTTIIKNHTMYTHLFCVILRIILGILVLNKIINTNILLLISIFVVIMFSYKFIINKHIWKVYMRTIIIYSIIGFLIIYNNKYIELYSILIITDALMGLQSRHIFDNIGYYIDNKIYNK
jgi:hypothetical protein